MKSISYHDKMKTRIFYLTLLFMLVAGVAQANDYLEKKKHYMVYSAGMDKIHFKVPVWSYGRYNNYYLGETSRIYYVKDGKD